MVLLMVSIGFITGTAAAFTALLGGASLPAALIAYAVFSASTAVTVGLLAAVVPIWWAEPSADTIRAWRPPG